MLREGSLNYVNWIKTPIPMYLEVTMFNWTNVDEVMADPSVKPAFRECGPYVFLEQHARDALDWHDENATITFNQTRTWHFIADKSRGSLDDVVTNLNVISATVAYTARSFGSFLKIPVNYILNERGGSLTVSKSVRELIFDGYDDTLLDFLKEGELPYDLPFDKFGWFYGRNESLSYDGRINMFTGQDDLSRMGQIHSWNGRTESGFYANGCGRLNGSTGELFAPGLSSNRPLSVFSTDICRLVELKPNGTMTHQGIAGARWVADDSVLDNGQKYPEQSCFCTGAPAACPDLMAGVMNVSECRYGAPAFVSFPHFYLADASYRAAVDGMFPSAEKHEFAMSIEPMTGIPLQVNARIQINILLQPIEGLK